MFIMVSFIGIGIDDMFILVSFTGIGIDDMFILVSSWRYTSFKLSTEERLGQTLKDAAVSITITSITDALAFGIGENVKTHRKV